MTGFRCGWQSGHMESIRLTSQSFEYMPANILNLPDYKVVRVEQTDHDYHITVEVSNPPGSCPACRCDVSMVRRRAAVARGHVPIRRRPCSLAILLCSERH